MYSKPGTCNVYYSRAKGGIDVRDVEGEGFQLNCSVQDQTFVACPQRGPPDPSYVLPLELLFDILGYLEATSLVNASAVSWRWRALCLSPRVWKVYMSGEIELVNVQRQSRARVVRTAEPRCWNRLLLAYVPPRRRKLLWEFFHLLGKDNIGKKLVDGGLAEAQAWQQLRRELVFVSRLMPPSWANAAGIS